MAMPSRRPGPLSAWAAAKDIAALIAGHHPENHASGRALQRLGFNYTHDELYPPTGRMEPCYLLQMIPAPVRCTIDVKVGSIGGAASRAP